MKFNKIIIAIFILINVFFLLLIKSEDISISDSKNNVENIKVNFDDTGETISADNSINTNDGYYYQLLSEDMKEIYDTIYDGVIVQKNIIKISPIKENEFKKIFYSLKFDNPELIQISDEFTYNLKNDYVVSFKPEYIMNISDYNNKIKEINNEILKIKSLTREYNDYKKELYIQDYILKRCIYSTDSKYYDNIYGAIIDGKANCRGYSAAFTYLLNVCGIQSGQIIGTAKKDNIEEGHSWNFVILDGEYYYCDLCWNDIEQTPENNDIQYHNAFFNLTYDEISETHNFNNQETYLFEINKTNSGNYSFLKLNGLYAYNYEEACDIIKTKLPIAIKMKKNSIEIKCDSKDLYNNLSKNIMEVIKDNIKNNNLSIKYCMITKIDSGNTIIIHDFLY